MHNMDGFMTWAVVLGAAGLVAGLGLFGGLLRRHAARLASCAVLGLSVSAGVTGWFGGIHHARMAAVARTAHVTVGTTMASTFAVTAVAVTLLALVISGLSGSGRSRNAGARPSGRRYAARGW